MIEVSDNIIKVADKVKDKILSGKLQTTHDSYLYDIIRYHLLY